LGGFIFRLFNFNPDGSLSWPLFFGRMLLNNSLTSALNSLSSESFMAAEIVEPTLASIDDFLVVVEGVGSFDYFGSFDSFVVSLSFLGSLGLLGLLGWFSSSVGSNSILPEPVCSFLSFLDFLDFFLCFFLSFFSFFFFFLSLLSLVVGGVGGTSGGPLGGGPLGSVPLGFVPLGSVPLGSVPLGFVPLGFVPLGSDPLGSVPLGFVPLGGNGGNGFPRGGEGSNGALLDDGSRGGASGLGTLDALGIFGGCPGVLLGTFLLFSGSTKGPEDGGGGGGGPDDVGGEG
jgi:hypothetical protein